MTKVLSTVVATLFATAVIAAEPPKKAGPPNIPENPNAKKVEPKKEAAKPAPKKEAQKK
jgi:hypothetical protein